MDLPHPTILWRGLERVLGQMARYVELSVGEVLLRALREALRAAAESGECLGEHCVARGLEVRGVAVVPAEITLVDRTVAIDITVTLLRGVLQIVVSSNQRYPTTESLSRMEENAR